VSDYWPPLPLPSDSRYRPVKINGKWLVLDSHTMRVLEYSYSDQFAKYSFMEGDEPERKCAAVCWSLHKGAPINCKPTIPWRPMTAKEAVIYHRTTKQD
jgi:hypothetical protein